MYEWLVYTGGLADVEVPLDEPIGGYVIVDQGKAAKFPKDVAEGLMQHGEDSAEIPVHNRQWRKATAKEIAAAEKGETAEPETVPAEEGDQS